MQPDFDDNLEEILPDFDDQEGNPFEQTDVYFFSGPIYRAQADEFTRLVEERKSNTNVALILSTYGGDADSAYIIARHLQLLYERFTVYVFGPCKSAGTIIVLGANEIVMSHRGELGPLDVQILKEDELGLMNSGLDIFDALDALNDYAFKMFEYGFLETKQRSGGTITTTTAAEIATRLAVGLLSPIAQQIDPLKLGEMRRAVNIAFHYGFRLCGDVELVYHLINGYPTHGFVIDFKEALDLFGQEVVRLPKLPELALEQQLGLVIVENYGDDLLQSPHYDGFIRYIDLDLDDEEVTDESTIEDSPFDRTRDKVSESPKKTGREKSPANGSQRTEQDETTQSQ